MGAFTGIDDYINRATGGNSGNPESLWFCKRLTITQRAGGMSSLWTANGHPGAAAAPGAVAVCDKTTAGAMPFTNPTGGRQKWLTGGGAACWQPGVLILYDRLLHNGGLSGTVTGAQTVQGAGSPPATVISRYTNGIGNVAFAEMYTAIGATGTSCTMSYIDENGADSTGIGTTVGSVGLQEANRMILLMPSGGDQGIQAVRTVSLTSTTGTAGNFGVTIAHPLAYLPITSQGAGAWRDINTGMPDIPEILPDACLATIFMSGSVSFFEVSGCFSTVEA